ncbi:MAG: hypothetical protein ACUVXJ_04665 [Phycisphaerae bacterium]
MSLDKSLKRRALNRDRQVVREELLRPGYLLAYDHEAMGAYLLGRQAFGLAEAESCRAVRLNPYDATFTTH